MAEHEIGTKVYNSNYVLDELIAEGGMSSKVYLAHHTNHPDVKLVVKIISQDRENTDEFFEAYRRESITSRRLGELPNLVHTYDFLFNEDRTEVAIVQDFVEGISLKDLIDEKGSLTPRVALSIFKQILIGVKGLHNFSQQIIHCDLKPENIVVSKNLSKVTIIDFGISSVIRRTKDKHQFLTTTGGHATEGYASPGYLTDEINPQYDFFALGVILYQMIMKSLPFKLAEHLVKKDDYTDDEENNRAVRTIKKPLKYDIPNISINPTIPVSLENLIFRCLASKPEDLHFRYNDISEILDDVDKAIYDIDHKINDDTLLKPVANREFEREETIAVTAIERNEKWYHKWWFAGLMVGLSITIIIIAVIIFLLIK